MNSNKNYEGESETLLPKVPSGEILLQSRKQISYLVRDQDCMAYSVGVPNQELQYGFALPSPSVVSHCHSTTERQIWEAQATFSEPICLIAVNLYPMVYRCLARSPAVSSFAHSC
ncbi:hypothetical protein TNCV_2093061 [Trichonephila clavipes]|nr:hypothetical protein TNCV_2093061 [Trichonephila clavipes]